MNSVKHVEEALHSATLEIQKRLGEIGSELNVGKTVNVVAMRGRALQA